MLFRLQAVCIPLQRQVKLPESTGLLLTDSLVRFPKRPYGVGWENEEEQELGIGGI